MDYGKTADNSDYEYVLNDNRLDYYADYDNGYYDDAYYDSPQKLATDVVYLYLPPFLLLLGTLGNALSCAIMYRLSCQVLSTCMYFYLLAVVDLLVLYIRCGNEWFTTLVQMDLSMRLMNSCEPVCKVYLFVFNFIVHLSKWLMVCVAIEGFIATRHPEKADSMCTRSRAQAVVLLLTAILVCVNIHFFWSYELTFVKEFDMEFYYCTFTKHGHQQSELFLEDIWPVLDLLIADIIPYLVIIICVGFITYQIATGRYRGSQRHQNWRLRYQLHIEAFDQLQVTILVVCIHFLLLTFPKFVITQFQYIVTKYQLTIDTSNLLLAHPVCVALEQLFWCGKFFLYFASSSQFRRECKKFLTCKCCGNCSHRQVIHPTASATKVNVTE